MNKNKVLKQRLFAKLIMLLLFCCIQTSFAAEAVNVMSSKPKKSSTNAAANMINVKAVDAVHYGKKNIRVCFLMTNSGNKTVLARITSAAARFSGNEDTRTTESIHMSGNGLFFGGDHIDQRIPAGASVKGYAYFDNLEDTVSVMDAAVLNAYYALSNDGVIRSSLTQ